MTNTGNKAPREHVVGRRCFLFSALAILFSGAVVGSADAQRVRRRMRRIRRRAIRRFHRRGRGIPDRARRAIKRGEIRPLRDVLAMVRRRSNAEVLDVDLHRGAGGWIYAVRVLTDNGRVRDMYVDGRTLEVLQFKDQGGGDGVPLPPELERPDRSPGLGVDTPPSSAESQRYQSIPPPVKRPPF